MPKDKIEKEEHSQLTEEQKELLDKRARDIIEDKVKLLTWKKLNSA
jgi:putative addiction module component (TIGR02574 family)